MEKTNVMRLLEAAHIPYQAVTYEYDESDLNGLHMARQLQLPPEQVFKTLVTVGSDGKLYVFCIPVSNELHLKKAAQAAGVKSVEMLKQSQLLPATGYLRGGCSPIGMKKAYPVWIDESAQLWDNIYVSAGRRGCQVRLQPADLMKIVNAAEADLTI